MEANSGPYTRKVRCGWCLDDNHENCRINVDMPSAPHRNYICPCQCNDGTRTRCNDCGRRGVETSHGRCLDVEECRIYRQSRTIPTTKSQQVKADRAAREQSKTEKATKGEAKCACCSQPTKGGRFLPGHDSRFVANLVGSTTSDTQAAEISVQIGEQCSTALSRKYLRAWALAKARAAKGAS